MAAVAVVATAAVMAAAAVVVAEATGAVMAAVAVATAAERVQPHKHRARRSGLFFGGCSVAHKQGHQGVGPDLPAPVAMHRGIEDGPVGQGVGRVEKLARTKDA